MDYSTLSNSLVQLGLSITMILHKYTGYSSSSPKIVAVQQYFLFFLFLIHFFISGTEHPRSRSLLLG